MGIAGYVDTVQVHDFFGYGKDAGLAGNEQEAVSGLAAKPTRPMKPAIVQGAIETVTR